MVVWKYEGVSGRKWTHTLGGLGYAPLSIDTRKYERLAIDSMMRDVDRQNRNALSHVPVPSSLPGLHRH